MTDPVTEDYLRQCQDGNHALLEAMSLAKFPPAFYASCGTRLLPRALFVAEEEIFQVAHDLIDLFDLLVSLPERLFSGSLGRYCDELGISQRRAELIWRFSRPPSLYGRADLYHDGESFKLLEYNIDSALGGTDRAEISRTLLEVEAFAEFAGQHKLAYVHTGQRVAQMLREVAGHVTNGADPVVALIEEDGGLPKYLHLAESFQEMMRGLGIELLLGEVSQVSYRAGRLYLHGQRVDVVLRYFLDIDILDESSDGMTAAEPIFRAHEDGNAVLWTTLRSLQVFNKGVLSLVSDSRWRHAYTEQERALVDRLLPWTRTLTDGTTEVEGQSVDLIDYCREYRSELIMKTRMGYGGDGVLAGWEMTDSGWHQALLAGLDQDYVVQQRVRPRREPVMDPATGEVTYWAAAWDAFLTPQGYAGSHIRALPEGDRAVINMGASGAARTTGVFYYPKQEARHGGSGS